MRRAVLVVVVVATALLPLAPTAAAKKPHAALLPGAGCTVADVGRGEFYTVNAFGLIPGDGLVQAWSEDTHGLQTFGLSVVADDGTASGGTWASWDGPYIVTLYTYTFGDPSDPQTATKSEPIATCSFTVAPFGP